MIFKFFLLLQLYEYNVCHSIWHVYIPYASLQSTALSHNLAAWSPIDQLECPTLLVVFEHLSQWMGSIRVTEHTAHHLPKQHDSIHLTITYI